MQLSILRISNLQWLHSNRSFNSTIWTGWEMNKINGIVFPCHHLASFILFRIYWHWICKISLLSCFFCKARMAKSEVRIRIIHHFRQDGFDRLLPIGERNAGSLSNGQETVTKKRFHCSQWNYVEKPRGVGQQTLFCLGIRRKANFYFIRIGSLNKSELVKRRDIGYSLFHGVRPVVVLLHLYWKGVHRCDVANIARQSYMLYNGNTSLTNEQLETLNAH